MKTLILRAIGSFYESRMVLGERDMETTRKVGVMDRQDFAAIGHIFHAPTLIAAETHAAYVTGWMQPSTKSPGGHYLYPRPEVAIWGLGDDLIFDNMSENNVAWAAFLTTIRDGVESFNALTLAYNLDQVKAWAGLSLSAVKGMFARMNKNGKGIGFFYSPFIEMAAWAASDFRELPVEYTRLHDLKGLIFACKADDTISVVGKV
jgi:hypothetical protein